MPNHDRVATHLKWHSSYFIQHQPSISPRTSDSWPLNNRWQTSIALSAAIAWNQFAISSQRSNSICLIWDRARANFIRDSSRQMVVVKWQYLCQNTFGELKTPRLDHCFSSKVVEFNKKWWTHLICKDQSVLQETFLKKCYCEWIISLNSRRKGLDFVETSYEAVVIQVQFFQFAQVEVRTRDGTRQRISRHMKVPQKRCSSKTFGKFTCYVVVREVEWRNNMRFVPIVWDGSSQTVDAQVNFIQLHQTRNVIRQTATQQVANCL